MKTIHIIATLVIVSAISFVFIIQLVDTPTETPGTIEINITDVEKRHGAVWVNGSVKNETNQSVRFVKLRLAWRDDGGNVVDTGFTYAVSSEYLRPGESSMFESVTKHPGAVRVTVSLLSYR